MTEHRSLSEVECRNCLDTGLHPPGDPEGLGCWDCGKSIDPYQDCGTCGGLHHANEACESDDPGAPPHSQKHVDAVMRRVHESDEGQK